MSNQINLRDRDLSARVNPENGQLVSLSLGIVDFFHNGGSPTWQGNGWSNSEIVPFPVFGPVKDYRVKVGDQEFSLDQHGIARHTSPLPFIVQSTGENYVILLQEYDGKDIVNSKFKPDSGRPERVKWLPYTLEKSFRLIEDSLLCELTITNQSKVEMPYMIAWHPAFNVLGFIKNNVFLDEAGKELVSLEQVIKASQGPKAALALEGINFIKYQDRKSSLGVNVSSNDYSNVILWSPGRDAGMVCIEHTSQLPVIKGQNYFSESKKFERLAPGEKRSYKIKVKPFK